MSAQRPAPTARTRVVRVRGIHSTELERLLPVRQGIGQPHKSVTAPIRVVNDLRGGCVNDDNFVCRYEQVPASPAGLCVHRVAPGAYCFHVASSFAQWSTSPQVGRVQYRMTVKTA